MNKIYANKCDAIGLGRQGENLATQVIFDLSDWIFGYGIGTAELIAQRAGDEKPYPVSTDRQGNQLIWAVSDFDTESATSYGRSGRCELRYYVGDILVKSRTWQTTVSKAMDTPSSTRPPAADQGWVEQVLATGAAAKASADAAKADADRASALAAQAAEKAAQTAQDASDAAKAMEAAQTAQRLAEEAQGAAETARTAAAAAQAAAEHSATDAAGAKKDAEAAMKSAQEAAAAAAKALADIRALYQEMQTWAQGVIQDVNDAGSVAVRSVQTTGDAQVQRVTAEGTRQTANAKAQADAAAQSASGAAQSAQQAAESASAASTSKTNAKASEESAKASETAAQASQTAAAGSASAAANSATSASASASAASESASAAAASATAAKASEEAAKASETAAKASETAAAGSASAAQQSATSAAESAAVYDDVVADVNQLKQDLTDLKDVTVKNEQASENIIESLTWTSGYMDKNGNVTSSSSLHYTNKISVKDGDILSSANAFRFVTAFCGDTPIFDKGDDDGNNMSYTVPEGIDGVIITRYKSASSGIIKTTTAYKNILEDRVKTLEGNTILNNMGYIRTSGNLSNGQTLSLPYHNVKNHNVIVFSANITSFDSLKIGKQTNTFVTIDNTNVSVTCDISSQNFSVAHGLTIQNNIQVIIENETSIRPSRIRVLSCGNEFEATIPNYARFLMDEGSHYVTSINSTLTDCAFSWTSRHINKPIWLFGDSYFTWYPERWTYYLARDGFTDSCMLNGFAGENSAGAYPALENLLKVHTPKMVVWCQGMNDPDNNDSVNESWKSYYDKVVSLSKKYGFELVLYTTPTTPTMNNRFKNAIVRNSGYRYVEADKSLRIDDDGNWIEGTLDDNVHPTIKGAKLLYHRFLADIPELTSKC